ncbi:hypothetical protein GCM10029964_056430 [Kibdelosporangium lantanae]
MWVEDVQRQCLADPAGGQQYRLENATIDGGRLDLSGTVVDRSLRFVGCVFPDGIDLRGARASKGIRLEGCELGALSADRLQVDGDLLVEGATVTGEVSLCGARLSGHLRCTGSEFTSTGERRSTPRGWWSLVPSSSTAASPLTVRSPLRPRGSRAAST